MVSIHAPARGATWPRGRRTASGSRFQSTPPHGGRPARLTGWSGPGRFQSTPPHGGRRWTRKHDNRLAQFQSTPPHGGRPRPVAPLFEEILFQSTPPHGGRLNCEWARPGQLDVSIHAPARGATGIRRRTATLLQLFQSTPPHGGRRVKAASAPSLGCFNPRPRTGGDRTFRTFRT